MILLSLRGPNRPQKRADTRYWIEYPDAVTEPIKSAETLCRSLHRLDEDFNQAWRYSGYPDGALMMCSIFHTSDTVKYVIGPNSFREWWRTVAGWWIGAEGSRQHFLPDDRYHTVVLPLFGGIISNKALLITPTRDIPSPNALHQTIIFLYIPI